MSLSDTLSKVILPANQEKRTSKLRIKGGKRLHLRARDKKESIYTDILPEANVMGQTEEWEEEVL